MRSYKAVIQLYVDGFTAEHQSEADLIINEYITEMEALRAWEDLRGRTLRY